MALNVYNTLNNRLEKFEEIEPGSVGLYTCGPTVYDISHIGNFRSYVFEDLVKRYLTYLGYRVYHVMNITDIDDKTIKKANDLGLSLEELTSGYIQHFFEHIDTLNILKADEYPRATDHIEEMTGIIQSLEQKGFAYRKGNSTYFSIKKFIPYGRLANVSLDQLKTGTGSDADEYEKDEIQDFVLWKGKKEGEPYWESNFGQGRPGWHIECSAMSMKYLGDRFDIHMGGVDNIFPHHENEIAQSEAATGQTFVNYWIHCQHLIVDNQKMSKSLGNFYTLGDILGKNYDPMSIRYLLLSTHYRKLLNFTFKGLEQAKQSLKRLRDFIFSLDGLQTPAGTSAWIKKLITENERDFRKKMDDDFNISGALSVMFDLVHAVNLKLKTLKSGDVAAIISHMERLDSVLGVLSQPERQDLDGEIQEKINQRQKARAEKNYQLADAIRDELKALGITLIDTPEGIRWKYE